MKDLKCFFDKIEIMVTFTRKQKWDKDYRKFICNEIRKKLKNVSDIKFCECWKNQSHDGWVNYIFDEPQGNSIIMRFWFNGIIDTRNHFNIETSPAFEGKCNFIPPNLQNKSIENWNDHHSFTVLYTIAFHLGHLSYMAKDFNTKLSFLHLECNIDTAFDFSNDKEKESIEINFLKCLGKDENNKRSKITKHKGIDLYYDQPPPINKYVGMVRNANINDDGTVKRPFTLTGCSYFKTYNILRFENIFNRQHTKFRKNNQRKPINEFWDFNELEKINIFLQEFKNNTKNMYIACTNGL